MNTLKFKPEGWNNEITPLDKNNINNYKQANEILQGLVKFKFRYFLKKLRNVIHKIVKFM